MLVSFPPSLRRGIMISGVAHDIAIVGMAIAAWKESPLTITAALGDYQGLWVAMLAVGGILGIMGLFVKNNRLESTGVLLVVAAKLVWIIALAQTRFSPLGAETLAFALMAGAFGSMWRFFGLWVGSYLRAGE